MICPKDKVSSSLWNVDYSAQNPYSSLVILFFQLLFSPTKEGPWLLPAQKKALVSWGSDLTSFQWTWFQLFKSLLSLSFFGGECSRSVHVATEKIHAFSDLVVPYLLVCPHLFELLLVLPSVPGVHSWSACLPTLTIPILSDGNRMPMSPKPRSWVKPLRWISPLYTNLPLGYLYLEAPWSSQI